jgi:hypothetical protein
MRTDTGSAAARSSDAGGGVATQKAVQPADNSGSPTPLAPTTAATTGQAAPDQKEAASASNWLPPRQVPSWCFPAIPVDESFSEKVIRILFRRDWCGPDPDVGTEISAGGAAGH